MPGSPRVGLQNWHGWLCCLSPLPSHILAVWASLGGEQLRRKLLHSQKQYQAQPGPPTSPQTPTKKVFILGILLPGKGLVENGRRGWWCWNDFLRGVEAWAQLSTLTILLQNQSANCHTLVLGLQFRATLSLSRSWTFVFIFSRSLVFEGRRWQGCFSRKYQIFLVQFWEDRLRILWTAQSLESCFQSHNSKGGWSIP